VLYNPLIINSYLIQIAFHACAANSSGPSLDTFGSALMIEHIKELAVLLLRCETISREEVEQFLASIECGPVRELCPAEIQGVGASIP